MEFLKIYEDFEEDESFDKYDKKWNQFLDFLNDHDFDLYSHQDDIEEFFKETANNDNFSAEEKAESIAGFLDEKIGIYDGYSEVYDFLQFLFTNN